MTDTCYGCKHLKMRDSPNYKWAGFLCEKNLPKKGELLGEVGGIDLVCKHPVNDPRLKGTNNYLSHAV